MARNLNNFVRKYLLLVVDILLISASLWFYLLYTNAVNTKSELIYLLWFPIFYIIWFGCATFFNVYQLSIAVNSAKILKRVSMAAVLACVIYLIVPFVVPKLPESRHPIFFFVAETAALLLVWRLLYANLFRHPMFPENTLIIGAGWTAREIVRALSTEELYQRTAYKLYGYIDDNKLKQRKVYDNLKVLSGSEDLMNYASKLNIDLIINAVPLHVSLQPTLYNVLLKLQEAGIRVRNGIEVYEDITNRIMVKRKKDQYSLTYDFSSNSQRLVYIYLNRFINILFSTVGLVLLIGIVPVIAVINLFYNKGSLFYTQTRAGKGSSTFTIYKFRTMVTDAEKDGVQWAKKGDERITKFGKFLRKTRLDELPQIWNVFRGEMNLIGPRPERPELIERLIKEIPFFHLRNIVKPGLTGWAQVNYRYGNSSMDAKVKMQYDLYYIKYRSFWLDMRILYKTIFVVLKFKGN